MVSALTGGRLYYGWFIVGAGFFMTMITMGTRSGFGVFIIPMSEDFGWSRGTISIAASLGFLMNGLSQPFLGRRYDRVGGRKLILISLVVMGLSTILLGLTNHIIFLVLDFGIVMAVALSGASLTNFSAILTKWFRKKRGTAVGIIAAGSSLGGLTLIPFTAYFIELAGWRWTWVMLGAIVLVLVLPLCFLFLKDDPKEMGLLPDGDPQPDEGSGPARPPVRGPLEVDYWRHSFRSSPMWLLCGGYWVCGLTTSLINTHFVPLAVDRGFSPQIAATAFGVLSAINVLGVMLAGTLGDALGRKNILGLIYLVRGGAFAMLLLLPGAWALWGFVVLSGFSWLGTIPLTTSLTADVYGLRNIGVLSGMVFAAHQVGGAIGVQMAGVMRDATGTYDLPIIISIAFLALAGLASFAIQERRYSARYQPAAGAAA